MISDMNLSYTQIRALRIACVEAIGWYPAKRVWDMSSGWREQHPRAKGLDGFEWHKASLCEDRGVYCHFTKQRVHVAYTRELPDVCESREAAAELESWILTNGNWKVYLARLYKVVNPDSDFTPVKVILESPLTFAFATAPALARAIAFLQATNPEAWAAIIGS